MDCLQHTASSAEEVRSSLSKQECWLAHRLKSLLNSHCSLGSGLWYCQERKATFITGFTCLDMSGFSDTVAEMGVDKKALRSGPHTTVGLDSHGCLLALHSPGGL